MFVAKKVNSSFIKPKLMGPVKVQVAISKLHVSNRNGSTQNDFFLEWLPSNNTA